MKKVLGLGIVLSFLFVSHSFAAYTLSIPTPTTSTITATMTGAQGNADVFQLLAQTTPFPTTAAAQPSLIAGNDPTKQTANAQGVVTWSIPEATNTTYQVTVVELPSVGLASYATSAQTVTTPKPVFTALTTKPDGNNVVVEGAIDPTKNGDLKTFSISLSVSTDQTFPSGTAAQYNSLQSNDSTNTTVGIAANGTYHFYISNLQVNTLYYYRQTISESAGTPFVDAIQSFNSSNGVTVPATSAFTPSGGGSSSSSNLSSSTYTLLSGGFPGLVSIPSAQQCATEQATATAQGKTPPICSVNDLLNYAMQLLIGLCGVVLVLRLMYEGYIYMVTDVPFLKASSKSGFMTALLGLLLALTSYVILNTINPKLVSETVNVTPLAIGVDGDSDTPTVSVTGATSQIPGGISCPGTGRSAAVTAIAQSFVGKVTYTFGGKDAATQSNGYSLLDCSGWANTVLSCAGYSAPKDYTNSGSADIFSGAEKVNMSSGFVISGSDVLINNIKLTPGSLVGWPTVGSAIGHVILYVGNGTFMDSHAGTSPGQAIGTFSASQLQSLYGGSRSTKTITSVKRTPL